MRDSRPLARGVRPNGRAVVNASLSGPSEISNGYLGAARWPGRMALRPSSRGQGGRLGEGAGGAPGLGRASGRGGALGRVLGACLD